MAPAKKTAGKTAKKATRPKGEARSPRFYPAYDEPAKKVSQKQNPAKVRASLTPGSVLILLAGRFRGKRVVLLKVLESGLLLVSGPFSVNGVPIKRVNPAYCIATSTSVDLKGIKIDAKLNDAYFKREAAPKGKKDAEGDFFAADKAAPAPELSAAKKADQKALDAALLKVVDKTPMLKAYLSALFTLTKGMKPHEMVF